jgi:hypothetical protein
MKSRFEVGGKLRRDSPYLVAGILYLVGVWLHIPYGGGHIYSDIPTVFQVRECGGSCLTIPYVSGFMEYPIIVSDFIYSMGATASFLPGDVLANYYWLSAIFLAIPTFLLIGEVLKIAEIVGSAEKRVLGYFIATPSFVFVVLVSWYAIGVYFAIFAIRKFLQGGYRASGILMGLSAASNLVTAAPALGLILAAKNRRDRIAFAMSGAICFGALNLPFIVVNPSMWLSFWKFHTNWYIEGSWMLAFLPSLSPLRHYIFPAMLLLLYGAIAALSVRTKRREPLTLSWMTTFAFLFSTYVFTPQMNIMLLPFFTLLPIVKRFWEFLAFDIINTLFVILGFSQILLVFGLTYNFDVTTFTAPVRWLAIIRSIWLGKMLVFDGLLPLARTRGAEAVKSRGPTGKVPESSSILDARELNGQS